MTRRVRYTVPNARRPKCFILFFFQSFLEGVAQAVSYTHLDVYKRQEANI